MHSVTMKVYSIHGLLDPEYVGTMILKTLGITHTIM